ncbi:MAG: fibronectin type III domain-containing protein [Bacteroidales bacterium]
MKRRLFAIALAAMLASQGSNLLAQNSSIVGESSIRVNTTASYSVVADPSVLSYEWIAPTGSRIISGQGTHTIELETSYISQDGTLKLVMILNDETTKSEELPIKICRYITSFQDHTIFPDQTFTLNGVEYKDADIYYESVAGGACDQVIAHRLTVTPREGVYQEMTKPYLQTATSNSIWINWKTNFNNSPIVRYGSDEDNLDMTQQGTTNSLSDSYFWNSVQLQGLEPNQAYYYQVESEGRVSEVYRFRTMPQEGSKTSMRVLLMGDHQLKSRSGYEWLMKAAERKIMEKYDGPIEDNINMIMNIGDQVDVGTLDQYEHIHLFKTELMSPILPLMTAVGNHETYQDAGLRNYAAHFHYEDLEYQGIKSGTENYYAYQAGRILFVVLSTEHTGNTQKQWVRKVVDAAKIDDSVEFIISVNHRPIQAEQYIGDISSWARNEIMPILSETPKHIFNYGGHHHLYHRGQLTDYPVYHIINGAASWDQMWGMSSEKDYDDVQKTVDYWAYQILEFDFEKREMSAECYAIGNKKLVVDNILIDSFKRTLGKEAPVQPQIKEIDQEIELPYTFEGSDYFTTTDELLNTTQFQVSLNEDFSTIEYSSVRDFENLYGSSGDPLHIPLDIHENMDITKLTIEENRLKNGTYFIRLRYRDANMEWSDWSDSNSFTVVGSIDGDPSINISEKVVALDGTVTINYEFAPEGQNAWIGVYRKGEKPGTGSGTVTSHKWAYTSGVSGSVSFKISEVNEFFAVLFEDGGYTEAAPRIPFYVGPAPVLSTDKSVYTEGEGVKVSFENAPGLKSDWIGIYKMGHTPSKENSSSWAYTAEGAESGELTLGKSLEKGYYFVTYLLRGEYFEPSERQFFSIGEQISTVSIDKSIFYTDEDINIHYNDGPGTPKDWVGVYTQGEIVDVDELDAFYYTYGETDGFVTVKAGDLPVGDYFCSLFINDSYDEVSARENFVIRDRETSIETPQGATVQLYPNPTKGFVNINSDRYESVEVYSTLGVKMMEIRLNGGRGSADLNSLSNGIYLFRFVNQNQETETIHIVKN